MKTIKQSLFILIFLVIAKPAICQDINFAQFYDLPLLRNPALAGIFTGDIRITSAYRSQWQSVTVPYKTIGLGIELKKAVGQSNDFITYGVQVTNDVAGDSKLSRTQVFPVFNYHKALSEENDTYISAGIMAGPVMQRFDPSKLQFDDQFVGGAYSESNPTRQTFTNTSLTYWDPAAGLCFSSVLGTSTSYYIGVGLFHFTKPRVAFQPENDIRLNPKYVVNAGFSAAMNEENRIIFYADYFMQGGSRQGQGGLLFNHDLMQRNENEKLGISAGMFYRMKDALMPVVKLDCYKMSIGITYEINTSKLKSASQYRGGYEVTLSYKAFSTNRNSSADKVRCPRFF